MFIDDLVAHAHEYVLVEGLRILFQIVVRHIGELCAVFITQTQSQLCNNTYFDLDELVAITFMDILELLEVCLDRLKLYAERAQFTIYSGALIFPFASANHPDDSLFAYLHQHVGWSLSASLRCISRRKYVSLSQPRQDHKSQFLLA